MRGFRRVRAGIAGLAASAVLLVGVRAAMAATAASATAATSVTATSVAATAASDAPELLASLGSTFAVTGTPGSGGASVSAGMLWPFENRFAFGAALFADDLGTGFEELHDPNTGAGLGTVGSTHRSSFGGEWRAEARLRESRRVRLQWGAGFGYGRQVLDRFGKSHGAVSGVLASTGLTFLYKASHGHAFGTTLAYKHQFVHRESDPERSTTWATAAFEWRWQGTPRE